jgi:hypothetical protein
MKHLNYNWLTDGLIDFEYKKYILLAYLQEVSKNFDQNRLYPFLSDLITHYNNIVSIKEHKQQVANQFPKKLTKIDLQNFKLFYENMVHDDRYMEVIEEIIDFAMPLLEKHLKKGTELYDFVEHQLRIFPVGVVPLHNTEGYLFVKSNPKKDTRVFEYAVTIFESVHEKYRGIRTQYLTSYKSSCSHTYEDIKVDLIRHFKKLPNPAVYAAELQLEFPFEETVLPIAKRALVKAITRKEV